MTVRSIGITCVLAAGVLPAQADDVDFNRDIRPILSNHCFQCHGPDDDARQAELRLDLSDAATADRDGAAAVVPGDPGASSVMERVQSTDPDVLMPPPEFEKPLTRKQIELIRQWIAAGAVYSKHWSFDPIQRPVPPAVRPDDRVRNPIDNFVWRRLAEQSLSASPLADRTTLIRRVYLDLLGLPPSIADVDEFLADERNDAYQQLLDRVLKSPHFGERWGRHWLDQAHYADSHGYTNDNERSMWPYRDWVIDAFNRDLPFDQFTTEQLAGDLLEKADLSQKVATGFHRNTLINSEGGTKADQFRDEQVKDRVDTTGLVWMGLTVGCAKCHTHKFDPITQHEYYNLYAFFNSTVDANSESPVLKVPTSKQQLRIANLEKNQESLQQELVRDEDRHQRQQLWEQSLLTKKNDPQSGTQDLQLDWSTLSLTGQSAKGAEFSPLADQSVVVTGAIDTADEFLVTGLSPLTTVRSVRLDVLTHDSLPQQGPGRANNGNFVLSDFWFHTGDGRQLRFDLAGADHSQPKYDISKAIDGKPDTGWAINNAPEGKLNQNRTAWFVLPEPLEVEENHALTFHLQFNQKQYSIGRLRLSISGGEWQDRPDSATLARIAAVSRTDRTEEQQQRLDASFLKQDQRLGPVQDTLIRVTKELGSLRRAISTSMVLKELDKPRTTYLQVRGDFLRTADEVRADVPAVFPGMEQRSGRRTRLDLARWLMRPDHPLTARVRVNRIWMRLFGRGLVETENDFGIQGTLPSHPQLLDWLADEFRRGGWSTKTFLKLVMNSATYRQSSLSRPEITAVDPRNLLLARQNRIRVEAEIVRDVALAVSGRLSSEIGGPGVYPPQEEGVYAFTQRKKNWKTSNGDDRYRRGIYTYFYRSAPYPMLETFDVPKFNATCTSRDRSNTPLQSLTIANSEAMFELAESFGHRIVTESPDASDDARLKFAFQLSFARPPKESESRVLNRYLQQTRNRFDGEDRVWTAVARLLMNLDEFITRE